ncbi:uncharacterized protein LOC127367816 isoform X2 [Dicentrarchus labrax]|uniref:uncharacterized protein LOC127367816 isoform X2 n=1 Tax=Dicentrarchus labrax TaxID=13489 RepID=UPI0021F63B02|nr:uncharacterized protein LOC127367816 isoform X2 [Dicentrarchus labrax]
MVEFRWITFSLFLMLVFSFSATGNSSFAVKVGDDFTLPCENLIHDQNKCNTTSWVFTDSKTKVTLIDYGRIHKEAEVKSDRLSVTADCSLVIKKVAVKDVGQYICKHFKSGQQQLSPVYLSVIVMTKKTNNDKTTLSCSVSSGRWCAHRVKWLYEGKHVDGNNKDVKTSGSECSVTVTFLASYLKQNSKYHEFFKCEVNVTNSNKSQLFIFSRQSSGNAATASTTSTTTIKSISTTGNKWTSVKTSTPEGTNKTASNNNETKQVWWPFIVALSALLIIILAVITWKRTKGNKRQMDENMADPEDGVSYASISFTRTKSKARIRGGDDDEADTVTYSTLKAP